MPSSQKQEMDKQDTFYKALARMAVKRAEGKKTRKNITHFFLSNKKMQWQVIKNLLMSV